MNKSHRNDYMPYIRKVHLNHLLTHENRISELNACIHALHRCIIETRQLLLKITIKRGFGREQTSPIT